MSELERDDHNDTSTSPLVVQYLYVHEPGERFSYPTVRAGPSASEVAVRYLECALVQAASLRYGQAPCALALATNVEDRRVLGRVGIELLAAIEALDVRIVPTEYRHRPAEGTDAYLSSRYVLDAILSASASQPADRRLWLTDLDCVWPDPSVAFHASPPEGEVGCIYIGYPPDWNGAGAEVDGSTRREIGRLARELGATQAEQTPPWVGGELLTGTSSALQALVSSCDELDASVGLAGKALPNEEQILSLAGATGLVRFRDLSHVAGRVPTGPRNSAARIADPFALGLWHLPSEKGLSLRRTAQQILKGRPGPVRRDLADPVRAARRFNVVGAGPLRRLQDDGWIVTQRIRQLAASKLRGVKSRPTR